ncbi:diguanylate cyclase domain-containing protein [Colwellia sp. C1TZA3]|uniref:diguanylate cyclase domain-containing protein n=1 Tax=Colwellia sp. C1TZA3 TaxID=2508879 RepID=UPI001CB8E7E8|nr:diguanylate cyclase [Colwellia sp. C1TZA3]
MSYFSCAQQDHKLNGTGIRTEQSNLKVIGDWQGEIKLSVSIGVSSFLFDDKSFDLMFSRADKALYQAKNYSRNKVMYL